MSRQIRALSALILILIIICSLSSCGEKEDGDKSSERGASDSSDKDFSSYSSVLKAVEELNAKDRLSVDFMLNITKSEPGTENEETLFFSQGSCVYQRGDNPAMSGSLTQIQGNSASTFKVYYKAGAYYTEKGDTKLYIIIDKDTFFRQFICAEALKIEQDELLSLSKALSKGGELYKFTADISAHSDYLFGLLGNDIYSLSGLKKVQKDKTEYGSFSGEYVIDSEGLLKTRLIEYTVTLYDTPPYLPGEKADEEDYKAVLKVSLTVSVKGAGPELEIVSPNTSDFSFLG